MLCRNSHFICKHVKHYKQRTPICTRTHIRTVGRPPKTHTYAAVVGENSLSIKFYSKLNLRPLKQGGVAGAEKLEKQQHFSHINTKLQKMATPAVAN